MAINIERIRRDIEKINAFNATPGKGITRLTFSAQYQGALNYVLDQFNQFGATVSICPGGNVRGRFSGSDENAPAVMMGSHLDSVVNGGQFDGVVGVVTTSLFLPKKKDQDSAGACWEARFGPGD